MSGQSAKNTRVPSPASVYQNQGAPQPIATNNGNTNNNNTTTGSSAWDRRPLPHSTFITVQQSQRQIQPRFNTAPERVIAKAPYQNLIYQQMIPPFIQHPGTMANTTIASSSSSSSTITTATTTPLQSQLQRLPTLTTTTTISNTKEDPLVISSDEDDGDIIIEAKRSKKSKSLALTGHSIPPVQSPVPVQPPPPQPAMQNTKSVNIGKTFDDPINLDDEDESMVGDTLFSSTSTLTSEVLRQLLRQQQLQQQLQQQEQKDNVLQSSSILTHPKPVDMTERRVGQQITESSQLSQHLPQTQEQMQQVLPQHSPRQQQQPLQPKMLIQQQSQQQHNNNITTLKFQNRYQHQYEHAQLASQTQTKLQISKLGKITLQKGNNKSDDNHQDVKQKETKHHRVHAIDKSSVIEPSSSSSSSTKKVQTLIDNTMDLDQKIELHPDTYEHHLNGDNNNNNNDNNSNDDDGSISSSEFVFGAEMMKETEIDLLHAMNAPDEDFDIPINWSQLIKEDMDIVEDEDDSKWVNSEKIVSK